MKGKYGSVRDAALDWLVLAGWSNQSDGSVDAPTGYFARLTNGVMDLPDCQRVLDDDDFPYQVTNEMVTGLIGHFLVLEGSDGFVTVVQFQDEIDLSAAYDQLVSEYEQWQTQRVRVMRDHLLATKAQLEEARPVSS